MVMFVTGVRSLYGLSRRTFRSCRHLHLYSRNTFLRFPLIYSRTMATGRSSTDSTPLRENRLAKEKSPYLLQHAKNPVDWYPWGEEAFQKAKKENKLIFLSVGYSTCHWCHVMASESFDNPETGKILNDNFVSVKVDREERPDVDKIYMTFIQSTRGGIGWPMNVWITPDLKPVVGGTYFPPDEQAGVPGFPTLLQRVAKMWEEQHEVVSKQGTMIIDALTENTALTLADKNLPGAEAVKKCYEQLEESYDKQYGGFGQAPKFPQPVNFSFLFHLNAKDPDTETGKNALTMTLHTLRMMAKGGVYDHIAQGFHRYSTDRYWHVPHFEKMLYDQAQLAVSYANAYQITKDDSLGDIAREILTYVSRDLSDKSGGFYSAEDADSFPTTDSERKKEGAFCVWTGAEIDKLLSDTVPGHDSVKLSQVFNRHYGISQGGNVTFEHDIHGELKNQNVMIIRGSIENTAKDVGLSVDVTKDTLAKCREILFSERLKRPKPHRDEKMISAWNGLMMSGFAKVGQVTGESEYTERAVKAANFIKEHLYDEKTGQMLRICYAGEPGTVIQSDSPIQGFLDDYAFLIQGLLDLYEACFDDTWLEWAAQLQRKQDELFWDTNDAGYFMVADGDPSIVIRMKEDQDGAEPNGNSVSAINLLRLSNYFNNKEWKDKAGSLFKVFAERLDKIPVSLPLMVSALLFYQGTTKQIIIRGDRDADDVKEMLRCVHSVFIPNKVVILADGNQDSCLYKSLEVLPTLEKLDGKATAYVCENYSCQLPVTSVGELKKLLAAK